MQLDWVKTHTLMSDLFACRYGTLVLVQLEKVIDGIGGQIEGACSKFSFGCLVELAVEVRNVVCLPAAKLCG